MGCAIVTGGSTGIGRAIALELARAGRNVIINYFGDAEQANDVKREVENLGVKGEIVHGDVRREEDVETLMDAAGKFGGIDVLVNNAGITKDGLVVRMSEADFMKVVETNLKGTFLCSKAAAGYMMKAKQGVIINMASVVGVSGNSAQANYAASKAGIIGLTKSLAKELAGRNIRVNAIAPGFIQTAMTDVLPDKVKEAAETQIPLARFGQPQDVANLVTFLASDKAGYITGQVIHVDGGMVM